MNSDQIFENPQIPWCIDLDGTLIKEDVTVLAFLRLLRSLQLGKLFRGLALFVRGYAQAKHYVETVAKVDVVDLTYNDELISLIKSHQFRGGKVYLATAADEGVANRVAEHLKLFDGVIASNGEVNRRATAKAQELNRRFGKGKYLYAGNSKDDLKVWPHTCAMFVVNAPESVQKGAETLGLPYKVLTSF